MAPPGCGNRATHLGAESNGFGRLRNGCQRLSTVAKAETILDAGAGKGRCMSLLVALVVVLVVVLEALVVVLLVLLQQLYYKGFCTRLQSPLKLALVSSLAEDGP